MLCLSDNIGFHNPSDFHEHSDFHNQSGPARIVTNTAAAPASQFSTLNLEP